MPVFGLPGVTATPRTVRTVGAAAVAVTAAAFIGWQIAPSRPAPDSMTVSLLTELVGTGIETGSDVRLDGVRVGSVESIDTAGTGKQRIELRLDRTQTTGLTNALSVDYAPGNLFGISEIELRPAQGGTALADRAVVDLTGGHGERTRDATISALLRSLGQLTNDVVTPQLVSVLDKIAHDTKAFTPLFQAIVTTVQAISDTQQLPPSYLLQQYGSVLTGLPITVQGLVDLLNTPFSNAYMRQPGKIDKFNANTSMIANDLLTAATHALTAGQTYYAGYVDILTPLLTAAASAVPDPEGSSANLSLLLHRLGAAMPDTPDGPVLNVAVDLRLVPALASPLSALLAQTPTGEAPR